MISSEPSFGITSNTGQFLNVNRGETIFLNHTLGDQDRIFKVVTIPGHKCDTHILAKSQLTDINGRTICQDITLATTIAFLTRGCWLIQVFWFERVILGEIVNINTSLTTFGFIVLLEQQFGRRQRFR